MKHILSIDFDFFQMTPLSTIENCYPDGVDLPSSITEFTWASHYANSQEKLMNVTINKPMLDQIIAIIQKQTPNKIKNVLITQSHRHIYDFIQTNIPTDEPCHIINIDMHHDCFNDNPNLDCGNWISHIKKNRKHCQISWIANPISETAYGLPKTGFPVLYDFQTIENIKFDLIFLCRSDSWLPPHLDIEFDKLKDIMIHHFQETQIERQVETPRNIDEILSNADALRKMCMHIHPKTK